MNKLVKLAPKEPDDGCAVRIGEGLGEIAAVLLDRLEKTDLIFIARDEARARDVAQILNACAGSHQVFFCPGSDALPGDRSPPTPANAGQRTSALRGLRMAQAGSRTGHIALVSTGESSARLYPQPARFDEAPPTLRRGQALQLQDLPATLEDIGYFADERVDEPGEFALRGSVADIYPADLGGPFRIEVADDRIAAIRRYDPISQRSLDEVDQLQIGRASEPDVDDGVPLLDHLPGACVLMDQDADKRRQTFLDLAADVAARGGSDRAVCPQDRWAAALPDHQQSDLAGEFGESPPRFAEQPDPLRAFQRYAKQTLKLGRLLLMGTRRDLRFLGPRINHALKLEPVAVSSWKEAVDLAPGTIAQLATPIPRGFQVRDMMVVAAADLLGSRAQRDDPEAAQVELDPFKTGELRRGDVVVHEDHGLCVIEGLEQTADGGDAIVLRFAAETRRLVPAAEAHRIWRYGADETGVTLDRLDGSSWMKRRGQVDEALTQAARDLTQLAAERLKRVACVLEPEPAKYERFVDRFAFTETADQAHAIAAVRHDLASGRPMDRLVVGDVGYGKTEVALRAAAIAAFSGKQVVVAVPTTVLARQHLESFTQRFEGTGIKVAGLSRLSSTAEKKTVKAGLADGSIAIVIGTAAVASKGVAYDDVGLVVIDEEQRFGAADKAKLAGLGADHVLTLSATPIPRTLQGALVGLQQLSIIATPPARRQPIRSTVGAFDDATVRAALLRERSRGGQSFVVVPRIEDIAGIAERLTKLVPELDVLQAHGKLPAVELDETMVRFAGGSGDVLLATNIIEAGLDVPRANTMIVWRADRFGLSQLHQLRGRVGRGSRRGQILLLTQPDAEIAPRTLARLNTLAAFDRLGAGFAISARDLDMRGAGDLLGEEQAGHAKLIGVELYQHLMERAIAQARGEGAEDWTPVIHADLAGVLPAEWIPDVDLRITLHATIARVADIVGLESLEDELVDRFGRLPEGASQLLAAARLRVLARLAGIARVDAGPAAIAMTPRLGHEQALERSDLVRSDERYLSKGDYSDPQVRYAKAEELLEGLV